MIERRPEEAPDDVRALATKMEEFAIEHRLLHLRGRSDCGQWVVTVEVPDLYAANQSDLVVSYGEVDL